MRAAGHHRAAKSLGEFRERAIDRGEVALDDRQGRLDLQHNGGIHDVLRGRTPVQIAPGRAALLGELGDQPDDGIADHVRGLPQLSKVDVFGAGQPLDAVGGLLRNNAEPGLDLGERHLNLDIARHRRRLGEDLAHGGRGEGVAENCRIEDRRSHHQSRPHCAAPRQPSTRHATPLSTALGRLAPRHVQHSNAPGAASIEKCFARAHALFDQGGLGERRRRSGPPSLAGQRRARRAGRRSGLASRRNGHRPRRGSRLRARRRPLVPASAAGPVRGAAAAWAAGPGSAALRRAGGGGWPAWRSPAAVWLRAARLAAVSRLISSSATARTVTPDSPGYLAT